MDPPFFDSPFLEFNSVRTEEEFTTRFVPDHEDHAKFSVRFMIISENPWLLAFHSIDSDLSHAVEVYRKSNIETTNILLYFSVSYQAPFSIPSFQYSGNGFDYSLIMDLQQRESRQVSHRNPLCIKYLLKVWKPPERPT